MSSEHSGLLQGKDGKLRCDWCGSDPLYQAYHDEEWARPEHNDTRLFEKICLEGFQAGLSWLTILKKRENFRAAFVGFDMEQVAQFNESKITQLMNDAGIIRHRGKIEAAIQNAQSALRLVEEEGSLDQFFWSFRPPASERPPRITGSVVQSLVKTPASERLAKELKRRGFRFVGPTTAYAFMQAMGMVNDHVAGCQFR